MVSEPRDRTSVLDHGYIERIPKGCWGSDELIIESARMSTNKGFLGWGPFPCPGPNCTPVEMLGDMNFCEHVPKCSNGQLPGDEKLLRALWTGRNHKTPPHTSPFEMVGMTFEVQAPIFVFREWHRHRTQSYNELSARYTALPDVNYVPTVERCMMTGGTNKQAQAVSAGLTAANAALWIDELRDINEEVQRVYQYGLDIGIPKEVARLPVSVNRYSRMRASANLLNWTKFLKLRMHESAQWEIRQYAHEVAKLVQQQFPRTYALFAEGVG